MGFRAGVLPGVLILWLAGLLVALGLSLHDKSMERAGGPKPRGFFPSSRPLAGAVEGRCPSGCTHSPRAIESASLACKHRRGTAPLFLC
jgi:hypothetical protein